MTRNNVDAPVKRLTDDEWVDNYIDYYESRLKELNKEKKEVMMKLSGLKRLQTIGSGDQHAI